jgi:hypothetical protein
MKPLSEIAILAVEEITNGQFPNLPRLAKTGLLNDFQYVWLKRFKIPYKFEILDLARQMCNGENKAVFKATRCKSIKEIRKEFSDHIKKWHNDDDRLILRLSLDGKQVNAEWIELKEYLESNNGV